MSHKSQTIPVILLTFFMSYNCYGASFQEKQVNQASVASGSLLYAQCNLDLGWIRAQSRLLSSPRKMQKIVQKLALKCSPGTFLEPERHFWYNKDKILYQIKIEPTLLNSIYQYLHTYSIFWLCCRISHNTDVCKYLQVK